MSANRDVFDRNLQRVDSLCAFYDQIKRDMKTGNNKEFKFTDMLRAATVFLHSAFEEYYREIITIWLPINGNRDSLKVINLPDDAAKNGTKYNLIDLLAYKDKTVEELFQESIYEYMNRTTFNSYKEICSLALKVGLDLSEFSMGKDIDNAVQRRHRIVHEADLDIQSGKNKLRGIQGSEIVQWRNAYSELVDLIDAQIAEW
ncbi:hypothetical protein SAMN04487934_11615 [Eubacterium ruminantium]|nr:hypothetical protein SAMN04487934_11615 [Eubacterium ruminantium]